MTIDTFFRRLRKFRGEFHFFGVAVRSKIDGRCPIISVAESQMGNVEALYVGKYMGLDHDIVCDLISAADWPENALDRRPPRRLFRRRLLRTLGLSEPTR